METAVRERQGALIDSGELVFCPHSRGVNLKLSGKPAYEHHLGERRNTASASAPSDVDKRWLNTKVCQHYLSQECPHSKYPALRKVPGLINALCNSRSILELTK